MESLILPCGNTEHGCWPAVVDVVGHCMPPILRWRKLRAMPLSVQRVQLLKVSWALAGALAPFVTTVHGLKVAVTSSQRWRELVLAVSTKPGHTAWNILLGACSSKAVVTANFSPCYCNWF